LLKFFWVPISLHRDPLSSAIDLAEIIDCEFNGNGSDVFIQAIQLCALETFLRGVGEPLRAIGFVISLFIFLMSLKEVIRDRIPRVMDAAKQQ
jgi:hypothetical protein